MVSPFKRMAFYAMRAFLLFVCLAGLALWLFLWWINPNRVFSVKNHLTEWLEMCPENGIRFVCNNSDLYDHLYGYVDFQKGDFGVGGDDFGPAGVTLTIVQGEVLDTRMSPQQQTKIERLINSMPERKIGLLGSYDFNRYIYFSVWKDHDLQIYVYAKNDLPEAVASLLRVFGPNLIGVIKLEGK
jgi:hypothetical protein